MTIEEIKELLQVFLESGVAELELQRGDNRLRLKRSGISQEFAFQTVAAPPPAISVPVTSPPPSTVGSGSGAAPALAKAAETDPGLLVKSPIVGTYYDAPSP